MKSASEVMGEQQAGIDAQNSEAFKVERIARVCHEANRAYCWGIGDGSQLAWELAPEWQRDSARKGVAYHLANPNSTPADSHESWLEEKRLSGWQFGPIKDADKKTHPCFVPYTALPVAQQLKDALFLNIVRALEREG